jgi:hypothetical protein
MLGAAMRTTISGMGSAALDRWGVGSMAVGLKTGEAYDGAPDVPHSGRVGYVAVTASGTT